MREAIKYPPLAADHWLVTECHRCALCGEVFVAGDETTLIALKPADEKNAQKARAGRPYTAVARAVHWQCLREAASVASG